MAGKRQQSVVSMKNGPTQDASNRGLDQHPRPTGSPQGPSGLGEPMRKLDEHPRSIDTSGAMAPVVPSSPPPAPPRSVRAAVASAPAATGPNGDEAAYPNRIGNYHKGLPHDQFGEVDLVEYDKLLAALNSGSNADFEAITLGIVPASASRKFTNPQAGLATDLDGPNPSTLAIPPAPALASPVAAAEAAELYWMALLRDVPFSDFPYNPLVTAAVQDLSLLDEAAAINPGLGPLTPDTLFRGITPGDQMGPFVSQFLLLDIPYGSLTIGQRQRTVIPGRDYLTRYENWLAVQNGESRAPLVPQDEFDGTRRHIRSMRDMGQYVHVDALYEAYLNACLILLGISAPFDPGNPYIGSQTQNGFGTFGGPHILSLVCEVATRALKAVWYQKWFVHRRLRPEEYGGLVHLRLSGQKPAYPLDNDILNSKAVEAVHKRHGTYLMPMAFPEGSPTHPSYGAGHATVAGACVTILKAWFDETAVFPNPKRPTTDGLELVPYIGPDQDQLTVGGELNKLAANIAIGRNMAGVHWRSDYTESIRLGEQVALCILKAQKDDYNEDYSFSLTTFDGTPLTISKAGVQDGGGGDYPLPC